MLNRRELLGMAVSSGAAGMLFGTGARSSAGETQPSFQITDTNISLFRWPFRRLPLDQTDLLVEKLRSLGISQAWAGSFEGLLHRDLAGVNRRLADACKSHPELRPIGSISPELPGWQDDLQQCFDEHNMPGIRLHPNYHGYTLDDPRFRRVLEQATAAGRFVQIAAAMEDTRTQHPMLRVPDVELAPLIGVMRQLPQARVQILNARLRGAVLEDLAELDNVYFDTARVEGTDGVPELVRSVSASRVMLGTHAPFLIPEAALIRTHESGTLSQKDLRRVLAESAEQFRNRHG